MHTLKFYTKIPHLVLRLPNYVNCFFVCRSSSLSAFRRYNSLPSPQAAPDPPVFLLSKEIKSEEGSNGCLATEVDEKECQRKRAETIMWEACNDQENIDVQVVTLSISGFYPIFIFLFFRREFLTKN